MAVQEVFEGVMPSLHYDGKVKQIRDFKLFWTMKKPNCLGKIHTRFDRECSECPWTSKCVAWALLGYDISAK